ncbi:MAG: hypothetical protein ACJAX5_002473 [Patiriisocius sp.]
MNSQLKGASTCARYWLLQIQIFQMRLCSIESGKFQSKRQWLNQLVAPLVAEGFNIEIGVHAFGKLHETIISNALDFGADYIFKPLRRHGTLQPVMYTSADWNLVWFCPCTLLLVSNKNQVYGRPILANLRPGNPGCASQSPQRDCFQPGTGAFRTDRWCSTSGQRPQHGHLSRG